jgi:hypothetical protein
MSFRQHIKKGVQHRWLLTLLILVHVGIVTFHISRQQLTYDEFDYCSYAMRWAHGQPQRVEPMDDSKTMMVWPSIVPRAIIQLVNKNYHANDYGKNDRLMGRYAMMVFSIGILLYVFAWARVLWPNSRLGLVAVGWLAIDPLFVSYAGIITSDMALGLFLIAGLYHLYRHHQGSAKKHYWLTGICLGLGIVAKQSFAFMPLVLVVLHLFRWQAANKSLWAMLWLLLKHSFRYVLLVLLVINCCYYFHHSFQALGTFHFQSSAMRQWQQALSFVHWLPIPLPENVLQSFDLLQWHAAIGGGKGFDVSTYPGVWLLGKYKAQGGFWYYYLVVLGIKLPLGTWLLLVLSVVLGLLKWRWHNFMARNMYWSLPIIGFLLFMSRFNVFQIGIRHLLFLWPLLVLAALHGWHQWSFKNKNYLLAICWLWNFVSISAYFPNLIPYTNELVLNKKTVFKIVNDSGLDYGQAADRLDAFLESDSSFMYAPTQPAKGKFVVSIKDLCNWWNGKTNAYSWLWVHQPIGHYQHAYILFEIK